ncbi:MAG: hypothetical protein ACJAWS_001638 [Oleiphilaceae bacterium]|jgi:hypothetical protein
MAWYFGARERRLIKKIKSLDKKHSKIKIYACTTGYKTMIHDCFHSFSYAGGMILFMLGIKTLLLTSTSNTEVIMFVNHFLSGVYMGSGFVLLELFVLLSKVNKSDESLISLNDKIKKLKSDSC